MTEIGDSSGIAFSGVIVNDDYNNKLVGRQGVQVYKQMESGDSTVRAALDAVILPILAARWDIEPASNSRKDKEIAKFVRRELMENGTRTWQDTLQEVLDFLVYGRMPFEIIWEFRIDPDTEVPYIGLKKLARRDPGSILAWKLKDKSSGVLQQTVNGSFEIPMDKLIVFVNRKKGENWEGISLLRSAYKHWYIKDKLYLIDAIASERQGLGVPYANFPSGTTTETKNTTIEVLENFRANEKSYLITEGEIKIEMMDMKAGTNKNLLPSIQHHDRAIALNVLAQFLMLGGSSVGSFALSADQSKLFLLCLEAIANYVRDTYQRYLIKKLVDFNYFTNVYPKLFYDKIGAVDHNILTTSLQRAMQIGSYTPQPEDEAYIRDITGMPPRNEKTDVKLDMYDDILLELDTSVSSLTEDTPDGVDTPVDQMDDQELQQAAEDYDLDVTYFGGAKGQPLSEETKRKISEALKRLKSKGGGKAKGKKKTDPIVKEKQAEIAALQKESRALSNGARKELLEMKARGEKLSEQDSARKQLDLMDKKNKLVEKIEKLKSEISARKAETAPEPKKEKKASEIGVTLDRINNFLDGDEK